MAHQPPLFLSIPSLPPSSLHAYPLQRLNPRFVWVRIPSVGGRNEDERKVETGPGVKGGGEKRMVAVRKGGSFLSNKVNKEGTAQERHGFAGGNVRDGYDGDDRGVRP